MKFISIRNYFVYKFSLLVELRTHSLLIYKTHFNLSMPLIILTICACNLFLELHVIFVVLPFDDRRIEIKIFLIIITSVNVPVTKCETVYYIFELCTLLIYTSMKWNLMYRFINAAGCELVCTCKDNIKCLHFGRPSGSPLYHPPRRTIWTPLIDRAVLYILPQSLPLDISWIISVMEPFSCVITALLYLPILEESRLWVGP